MMRRRGEADLDSFLGNRPGQRAAVTGFVNYLNTSAGLDLRLPARIPGKVASARRKWLEKRLLELARRQWKDEDGFLEAWIPLAMEYFHGKRMKKAALKMVSIDKAPDGGGVIVREGGSDFWIPVR